MDEKREKKMRECCFVCNKTFANHLSLRRHMACHTGNYDFECSVCHKGYNRSDLLKQHELTHTGKKDHICQICGKWFFMAGQLRRHLRIHSNDRDYSCSVCGKTGIESSTIKKHILAKHRGEEARILYKNDSKNKRLDESKDSHLKAEIKIEPDDENEGNKKHNDETCQKASGQQTCGECGKCFLYPASLKNHMRIHFTEKPYSCGICGHTAVSSRNIKLHIQSQHEEKNPSPEHQLDISSKHKQYGSRSQKENITIDDGQKQYDVGSLQKNDTGVQDTVNQTVVSADTVGVLKQFLVTKNKSHSKGTEQGNDTEQLIDQSLHYDAMEANCLNSSIKATTSSECKTSVNSTQALINSGRQDITVKEEKVGEEELAAGDDQEADMKQTVSKFHGNYNRTHKVGRRVSDVRPFSCSICGQKASESGVIKRHILAKHKGSKGTILHEPDIERPHKCDTCGKGFLLERHLRRHLSTHGNIRPYSCSVCGKNALESSTIRLHILNKHKGKQSTILHFGMDMKRVNVEKKSEHEKENNTEHRIELENEHKRCENKQEQKRTVREKKEKTTNAEVRQNKCDTCGKCFSFRFHLREHARIHNYNKPYSCSLCGQHATESAIIQRHILANHKGTTGEVEYDPKLVRQHKCDTCGKCFFLEKHLRKHQNAHSDVRPYYCSICGKNALESRSIKAHILRKHKGKQGSVLHENGTNMKPTNIDNQSAQEKENSTEHNLEHMIDTENEHNICEDKQEQKSIVREKKKKTTNTATRQNKCDICGKCFVFRSSLKKHELIHRNLRPYSCSICGQNANESSTIKKHILLMHKGITGKVKYQLENTRRYANENQGEHGNENESEQNAKEKNEHEPSHGHNGKAKHRNKSKLMKRQTKSNLKASKDGIDIRPFSCSICGHKATESGSIKKHIRAKHKGSMGKIVQESNRERRHKCDTCGKCFFLAKHLRRHLNTHSTEKPYSCSLCGKTATESSDVKKHLLRKHKGEQGTFLFNSALKTKNINDENNSKKHEKENSTDNTSKCLPECESENQGQNKQDLKNAVKRKRGRPRNTEVKQNNRRCDTCGKHFSLAANLRRHQRIHNGDRPYSCSICGQTGNESSDIRKHIILKHKGENGWVVNKNIQKNHDNIGTQEDEENIELNSGNKSDDRSEKENLHKSRGKNELENVRHKTHRKISDNLCGQDDITEQQPAQNIQDGKKEDETSVGNKPEKNNHDHTELNIQDREKREESSVSNTPPEKSNRDQTAPNIQDREIEDETSVSNKSKKSNSDQTAQNIQDGKKDENIVSNKPEKSNHDHTEQHIPDDEKEDENSVSNKPEKSNCDQRAPNIQDGQKEEENSVNNTYEKSNRDQTAPNIHDREKDETSVSDKPEKSNRDQTAPNIQVGKKDETSVSNKPEKSNHDHTEQHIPDDEKEDENSVSNKPEKSKPDHTAPNIHDGEKDKPSVSNKPEKGNCDHTPPNIQDGKTIDESSVSNNPENSNQDFMRTGIKHTNVAHESVGILHGVKRKLDDHQTMDKKITADYPVVKDCFVYLRRLELSELLPAVTAAELFPEFGPQSEAIESDNAYRRTSLSPNSSNSEMVSQESDFEDYSSNESNEGSFQETEANGTRFVKCIHEKEGHSESLQADTQQGVSLNCQIDVDSTEDPSNIPDDWLNLLMEDTRAGSNTGDQAAHLFDRSNDKNNNQSEDDGSQADEWEESDLHNGREKAKSCSSGRRSSMFRNCKADVNYRRLLDGENTGADGCYEDAPNQGEKSVLEINDAIGDSHRQKLAIVHRRKQSSKIKCKPPRKLTCKCDVCHKYFASTQVLLKHRAAHAANQQPIECYPCGQKFISKGNLTKHNKRFHPELSEYPCSKCGKGFNMRFSYLKHGCKPSLRLERYLCHVCGYVAKNYNSFFGHQQIHSSVKQHICHCCGKQFTTKSQMKRHLLVIHSDIKPFSCDKCDQCFKTKDELKSHTKRFNHEKFMSVKDLDLPVEEKQDVSYQIEKKFIKRFQATGHIDDFACDMCSQVFKLKWLLDKHMLQKHAQSKTMATKESFKHIVDDEDDENENGVERDAVDRQLGAKRCLTPTGVRHRVAQSHRDEDEVQRDGLEDGQEQEEMNCNAGPPSSSGEDVLQGLNDHQRKINSGYQCDICNKTYKKHVNARNHVFLHFKEKLFSCEICKKLFRTPASLYCHMSYHSDTVTCEVCEKKMLKCKLAWHMKSIHKHLV